VTKLLEQVAPSAFHLPDPKAPEVHPQEASAEDDVRIRRLEDQPNGGRRYDVLEYIQSWGITRRDGQVAVYMPNDRALVFTGTTEDHDLLERVTEPIGVPTHAPVLLQIGISVWTYLDDPAALVENNAISFEAIRKIGGDSLRPVDSHLIVTRSGNRATSTHRLASGDAPAKSAETPKTASTDEPLNSPGSETSVEPVLGPDGAAIDFAVKYRARIPQADAPDLCFSHATNVTVISHRNVVVQNLLFTPTDGQNPAKVRRCPIVASARALKMEELIPPALSKEEKAKREQQLIEAALNGLPKR
jgi:hypothetical protein